MVEQLTSLLSEGPLLDPPFHMGSVVHDEPPVYPRVYTIYPRVHTMRAAQPNKALSVQLSGSLLSWHKITKIPSAHIHEIATCSRPQTGLVTSPALFLDFQSRKVADVLHIAVG